MQPGRHTPNPRAPRTAVPGALPLAALLALFLVLPLGLAGCGGDDEASIEERLEEKGTMDVIEEASAAEYDPPADGRLSDDQMEMYIEVQERALKIRQVAQQRMEGRTGAGDGEGGEEKQPGLFDALRAVGDLGDLVTAELRAAQELGHNPAEYQWVQGQIVEAQLARMGQEMQKGFGEAGQTVLASLKEQRDNVEDPDLRRQLDEQIEQYEANLAEQRADSDLDPDVAHNIELFEEYRERIEALQQDNAEAQN